MSEHLAQITTRPFTQNPVPAAPKVAPKVPSRPAPKPFTKGPTNDDPQNLTKQIMPLLQKLRINTIIDGNKTELFIGQMKKMGINNMSLYKVMFRRTANIDDQIIDRLKRSPNFESLDWSENGIVISLWWEYQTGAQ